MIKIFTDSAANLPTVIARKQKIGIIPLTYTVNGVEAGTHSESFNGTDYYNKIRQGATVKTSMVNCEMFIRGFEEALANGDDIIYIGLSSGISGTVQAARNAARELSCRYTERKIEIIDSLGASLGEGMLALRAAELAKKNMSIEEIKFEITSLIPHMCQSFTVDNLKYLKQGGRISGATALIGGLLGIRPVLIGNGEGSIVMLSQCRGSKQVLDALAERYERLITDISSMIGISHADNPKGAAYLLEQLHKKGFCGKVLTVCHEPVTGAHIGPGAVALFFFGSNRCADI